MAANARYEQAPQRDSFEEREFSQPPPSYQATPDFSSAPRSEGDNLPDDFKVCSLLKITWDCEGRTGYANVSSSVAPSRRRPFPSVCSLSGRFIRSCEYCSPYEQETMTKGERKESN